MADSDPAAPPPAQPAAAPAGDAGERLTRVENKIDALSAVVARLVPGSHADAQAREEQRLDRPTSVEEQVQAELAKVRDQEARDKAAADAQAERETVAQRLAKLEERPPAEPRSRLKRIAGGWG